MYIIVWVLWMALFRQFRRSDYVLWKMYPFHYLHVTHSSLRASVSSNWHIRTILNEVGQGGSRNRKRDCAQQSFFLSYVKTRRGLARSKWPQVTTEPNLTFDFVTRRDLRHEMILLGTVHAKLFSRKLFSVVAFACAWIFTCRLNCYAFCFCREWSCCWILIVKCTLYEIQAGFWEVICVFFMYDRF